MPAKLRKKKSRAAKKPEPAGKSASPARPKLVGAQREYAKMRLFLSQDAGFRLGTATFDRIATRDGLMERMVDDLAKSQILLSTIDLLTGEDSLLARLEDHLKAQPTPEGWHRAVAVINLEAQLDRGKLPIRHGPEKDRDVDFLWQANFHRDAFPKVFQGPFLIWLTALSDSDFMKSAPDLWHWRSARFDFEREGAYLDDFRTHPAERIAWFEKIAAESHRLGDRRGEIGDLISLGNAKLETGDARGAIPHYEGALALAREIGDRFGEGNALGNLGLAYADLGDTRKAIEFYEQHRDIAREIGDRRGEGIALGNLGNAYLDLGDARKAIEFYEQHRDIAREIGDRRGEGNALGNLGLAYWQLGDARKAIEFHEQALALDREIGDRHGEGDDLGNLGLAYADMGDARKSIEFYEQHLAIAREIGDRRGEGSALFNSALALASLGEKAEAIRRAEAALRIFEAIEDPWAAKVRAKLTEWRGETAGGGRAPA